MWALCLHTVRPSSQYVANACRDATWHETRSYATYCELSCHWSTQHWYVSIMCLHTFSSICVYTLLVLCHWSTLHWYVIIMCLKYSLLVLCHWSTRHWYVPTLHYCLYVHELLTVVPSKPYFYPWVKYMPLFMDQSIVSMVSVLVLCSACVCTNFMPILLMQGRCTWCSSVVTQLLDC